jgi:uncharacterized membrane protein
MYNIYNNRILPKRKAHPEKGLMTLNRGDLIRWYGAFAAATAACFIWVLYRVRVTGTESYTFMMWNLFLAWIPMWAATGWHVWSKKTDKPWSKKFSLLLAAAWLVFLPNASYVATDFVHFPMVRNRGVWPWSDLFMLMLFVWTAVLLGFCSLYLFHSRVRARYGAAAGWAFCGAVILAQAAGVYVGRELRWNSWWVLTDPKRLVTDMPVFLDPGPYKFIAMAGMFCGAVYLMIYSMVYRPAGSGQMNEKGTGI